MFQNWFYTCMAINELLDCLNVLFMLAFALCFVLLKQNNLLFLVYYSLNMSLLSEKYVGKIISTHPHGPKII